MFPKEVTDIILKYQSENDELCTINAAIDEIIFQLQKVNDNITEKINLLLKNLNTSSEEIQLLHDSQKLREYISTLHMIENDKETSCKSSIDLYVCHDNICPKCNWKMYDTVIKYKNNNNNTENNLIINICPNCKNQFVIDYDLEDIDLKNTNINLYENYYIRNELVFNDVIVLNTISSCIYQNHHLADVEARIPIIKRDSSIDYISRSISYCKECNQYIMLKGTFNDINDVIACRVIDNTTVLNLPANYKSENDEIEIKQKQSILYQYGYNVKTKENLSDKQRHLILSMVVESNILTRTQIISHLDTLIERGNKIPNWKDATIKWKQDRHYISKYNSAHLPKIVVDKLILKYKETK